MKKKTLYILIGAFVAVAIALLLIFVFFRKCIGRHETG